MRSGFGVRIESGPKWPARGAAQDEKFRDAMSIRRVGSAIGALVLGVVSVAFSPAASAQEVASPRIPTTFGGSPCVPSIEGPVSVTADRSRTAQCCCLALSARVGRSGVLHLVCLTTDHLLRRQVRSAGRRRHTAPGVAVVEPLHSGGIFGVLTNISPISSLTATSTSVWPQTPMSCRDW